MRGADLLEREAELRVLETLVGQASGGDGGLGLIEGAPGIGKTSLVSAAARLAAEAGMRCLSARGSPMERAFPFGVVRQLFEPVLAAEPAERGEVFGGPAARVERLLAGGDEPTSHGGGSFAVYHGLYWLTVNLSGAGEPPGQDAISRSVISPGKSQARTSPLSARPSGRRPGYSWPARSRRTWAAGWIRVRSATDMPA